MAVLASLGWDSYTSNTQFNPSTPTIGTADELGTGVTLGEVGTTWLIAGQGIDPSDGSDGTTAWRASYNTGGNQEIHINLPSDQSTWSMRFMWRFASSNGATFPRWIWLTGATAGDVTYSQINGTNYDIWFYGSGNNMHIENWTTPGEGGGTIWRRTELKYDENDDGLIHISTWNDPMSTEAADFTDTQTPFDGANNGAIDTIMLGHTTTGNVQPHFYLDNVLVTDTYEDLGPPPYSTGADVNLTGTVSTGASNVIGGLPIERALDGDIDVGASILQGMFGVQGETLLTGLVGIGTTDVGGMFHVERGFSGTIDTGIETNGTPLVGITALDVPYAAHWANDTDQRLDDPTGKRLLDVYYPEGTPPATGWPVVVWCHGGRWNAGNKIDILEVPTGGTSDNGAPKAMLDELIGRGIAVVSVGYRLAAALPNGPGANVFQWPDPIDDIQLAMSFLVDNADSYQIDMRFPVLAGFSAGGYLALMQTLVATMPSTTVDYWDHVANGTDFKNMDAGTRYTGGPYPVQPVRPIGIGMWEAPIDMHWNTFREGSLSAFYVADNSIRGLVGDDDFLGDGGSRIPAARVDYVSPAFHDAATGQWMNANVPPAFYVCCQTVSWTNTPVATLNNGTTFTGGGNGYALREEWAGEGVPFEEHVIAGANHDDINNYASIDFANWVEHLLNLEMSGTIDTGVTVSGTMTVEGIAQLDGTAAGTATATGTLEVIDLNVPIAGTAAGTGTTGGSLTKTAPIYEIDGTAAGTATATGTITVVDAPTYDLDGTAAGAGVVTGTLSIQVADTVDLTGVAAGSGATTATLTSVAPPPVELSGLTAAGVGAVTATLTSVPPDPIDLNGTPAGLGTITGTLSAVYTPPTHDIAGTAAGTGTATGALSVGAASFVDLFGVAAGTTGLQGALSKLLPNYVDIAGSVAGTGAITGTVFAAPPGAIDLTGQTVGTSTVTGTLQVYDISLSKWWYRDDNSIVEVELIGWMDSDGNFVAGTYPDDLEYLDLAP